jgi:hypothetical protein
MPVGHKNKIGGTHLEKAAGGVGREDVSQKWLGQKFKNPLRKRVTIISKRN